MSEEQNPLLAAALEYARRGWPVLPLAPRGKAPLGALVPRGLNDATTDPERIRQWWATRRSSAHFMNSCDFMHFPWIKCQRSETSIAKSPLQRLVAESLFHTRVSRQKYLAFGPPEGISALEMANLW